MRLVPGVRPRLAIDARMVGPHPHGVARYVARLAEGLAALNAREALPYELVFLVAPEFAGDFYGFETLAVHAPFLGPSELVAVPRALRRARAALYHSPSFSSLLACPCPWVVTVHDLNHLFFGTTLDRAYYRFVLRPFVRRASAVATVSQFSRDELAPWANLPAEAITIALNALDPALKTPVASDEAAAFLRGRGLQRGKYFLSLTNPKPHKNVATLVDAYRAYRARAGTAAWPLVLSLRGYENEPGVQALGPIGDLEGRALLENAGAVVFPSLYEGFGLPPVEAAAVGVPLLVSRIAPHLESLMEFGGDQAEWAIWVDPLDAQGWSKALEAAAMGLPARPPEAVRAGLFGRYAPETLAVTMDAVYRDVLKKKA